MARLPVLASITVTFPVTEVASPSLNNNNDEIQRIWECCINNCLDDKVFKNTSPL